MKHILLLTLIAAACLSLTKSDSSPCKTCFTPLKTDSAIIEHNLDGKIIEWPADKFSADKESTIEYAIDNDDQNLYMALRISNLAEQMKLMRMGMSLYIDLKGKHKKNESIDFPLVKTQGTVMRQEPVEGNNQPRKPDMKMMRMMFALNLISMKLTGFAEGEPVEQNLETEGSARIAYEWDSTDVMQIEYLLPLKMLGEVPALNQKQISVGWKVNGAESSTGSGGFSPAGPGGGAGGRSSGRPGTIGRGGAGPGSGQGGGPDLQKMMEEQEFWAKYTLVIRTGLKGF